MISIHKFDRGNYTLTVRYCIQARGARATCMTMTHEGCSPGKWPDCVYENPLLCMHEFIQNSATRFISCNFTRNCKSTRRPRTARRAVNEHSIDSYGTCIKHILLAFACAKWGPVLRAPLEYYGFSIGTEWPVGKFGSSEIHRCTVGFPQTIS